jgi:NAD(P)-dependent dehydrogenase (short-subunit alcohol dehydrogenase family)
MKTIVITGSTRGIGLALAGEFLRRDCQVVISGRSDQTLTAALESLSEENPSTRFTGFICNVRSYDQIQALWNQSKKTFGEIDIWINNAGISNKMAPAWEIPTEEIRSVVETNVLGEMFGTKVALQGFLEQKHGALYNVEGMGADGKTHHVHGLSIYGSTKAGLHFFNKSLTEEIDFAQIIVGALQPGMILTDMVKGQYRDQEEEWEKAKGILGLIANPIEDVVPWLAEKILTNKKNGAYFRYSRPLRMVKRMILLPFRK